VEEQKPPEQRGIVRDIAWVLGIGSQAGLALAIPVLLGLAVGYLLDRHFGTLPWISLVLTLFGIIGGPIMVYRLVTRAVQKRLDREQ